VRLAADRARLRRAHLSPTVDAARDDAVVEHEATTTRISEERLFYCQQRGIARKRPRR
jgi:Fe-S cluster assembly scaffold protein SufB